MLAAASQQMGALRGVLAVLAGPAFQDTTACTLLNELDVDKAGFRSPRPLPLPLPNATLLASLGEVSLQGMGRIGKAQKQLDPALLVTELSIFWATASELTSSRPPCALLRSAALAHERFRAQCSCNQVRHAERPQLDEVEDFIADTRLLKGLAQQQAGVMQNVLDFLSKTPCCF